MVPRAKIRKFIKILSLDRYVRYLCPRGKIEILGRVSVRSLGCSEGTAESYMGLRNVLLELPRVFPRLAESALTSLARIYAPVASWRVVGIGP